MSKKSLAEIAKQMAGIDIAILSTHTEGGEIANRPMSNNGDVTYDGTSYYFTYEQARAVSDIQRDPQVALGFSSEAGIFSDGIYVAVEGTAELIRDKAAFKQHWTSTWTSGLTRVSTRPALCSLKLKRSARVTGRVAKRVRSNSERYSGMRLLLDLPRPSDGRDHGCAAAQPCAVACDRCSDISVDVAFGRQSRHSLERRGDKWSPDLGSR
jgi:general stress protein 26